MRRQRTRHAQVMTRNPHSHVPNRIEGSGLPAGGTIGDKGNENAGSVNGWLTWSITTIKLDCVVSAGAIRHRTWPPNPISSEHGMRSLHEAASHTQWRSRA
jgi:hypothetical protein